MSTVGFAVISVLQGFLPRSFRLPGVFSGQPQLLPSCFLGGFLIFFRFLCFELTYFFLSGLQSCTFSFQLCFQRINIRSDRCDFCVERFDGRLLFCNLRCKVVDHFGLVFAAFGLGIVVYLRIMYNFNLSIASL